MKLEQLLKSRVLMFNAIVGVIVPIANAVSPGVLPVESVNQILLFGNVVLRFITTGSIEGK